MESASAALEVDFKSAKKLCVEWFKLSLDEALLIWKARNLKKHGEGNASELKPWHEIRKQYHDALKILRLNHIDLPDSATLRCANRASMDSFITKAQDLQLAQSIIAHVHVNGNSPDLQQQRQLHNRLNSRTARVVAGTTKQRATKQTRLPF